MAHDDDFYEQLAFEQLIPEASRLNNRSAGYNESLADSPDMEFVDGDDDDEPDEDQEGLFGSDRNPGARPAMLTLIPTSTTDPDRPRTLAAGWDRRSLTLSVVFRDGTVWNYYEVDAKMWQRFANAISKGAFIYTYLDHTHGARSQNLNGPAAGDDARVQAVVDYARARQASRRGVQTGQAEGYFGQDPSSRRRARAVAHVEAKKAGLPTRYKSVGEALGYKRGNLGGTARKRMEKQLDTAIESFFQNRGRTRPPGI